MRTKQMHEEFLQTLELLQKYKFKSLAKETIKYLTFLNVLPITLKSLSNNNNMYEYINH